MARRKQRVRSPHPGVVLKRRTLPSGATAWRARYTDPDTGRVVYATLDLTALGTAEARKQWAIAKARELARVRMDRAAGIEAPKEGPPIAKQIATYLEAAGARLRPRTLQVYGTAIERFRAWTASQRIERTSDLTRAHLVGLRNHLIATPKSAERGGARKARRARKPRETRSGVTVNSELRAIKTMLNAWRTEELVPQLTSDDIADALPSLKVARERPTFLRPNQLRALLEAAMRHDAECFVATRAEHARGIGGTTPRYRPIAPFVAFLMLTGCRRGEALSLTWSAVDLAATDHGGKPVGEIVIEAHKSKTHAERTVGLEVAPGLRRLLAAMKLRGGKGHVFGGEDPYTADLVESSRRRLISEYGAPAFDWQTLRSTCGSYLTNAPGIFGAASVFSSARQLGHSVAVAERHYLNVIRGISRDARTLEAAMQIDAAIGALVDGATTDTRAAVS